MTDRRTNFIMTLSGNVEARSQAMARSVEQMSTRANRAFDAMKRKTADMGREMQKLGQGMQKHAGKVATAATAAAVWKGTQALKQTAALDKQLSRTRLNAEATKEQEEQLRALLHTLNKKTGVGFEPLQAGFDTLIASGQDWNSSLAMIEAIAPAMAVTGAQADVLASALGVAKENFNFDLSDVKTAVKLIDQMTRGGRLGNAELENLSNIFARVGGNARTAGMDFEQVLAFTEQLSLAEPSPERLGTLTDSTLRIFTNDKYRKNAEKATGVKFYNPDGSRRDPFEVLQDIGAKAHARTTDKSRDAFLGKAFGEADQDTIRGLRNLFKADSMSAMRDKLAEVQTADGLIARELPLALDNAADQAARLAAHIREAADNYMRPVAEGGKDILKYGMGDEMDAPWQTAGKAATHVGGGLAALAAGTWLFNKMTGGVLSKAGGALLGKFGGALNPGTGGFAGALGKAAIPVYVTNFDEKPKLIDTPSAINSAVGWTTVPDVPSVPDVPDSWAKRYGAHRQNSALNLKTLAAGGAAGLSTIAAGGTAAAVGGYAAGSMIYNANADKDWMNTIGRGIAKAMSLVSQEARDALAREEEYKSKVDVTLKVEAAGGATAQVTSVKADGAKADVGATQGHY